LHVAWDKYNLDFEQKSQFYIEKLKKTHESQLLTLKQSLKDELHSKPPKWSRDLMDWRKRESIMVDRKLYREAQQIKLVSDALEEEERANMNSNLESLFQKKERHLKKQQRAELDALEKRIETKRRENKKLREENCGRLLQRNKNIVAAMDSRHASECLSIASKIKQQLQERLHFQKVDDDG